MGIAGPLRAQDARTARLGQIQQRAAAAKTAFDQLPAALRNTLSGPGRLAHLAGMMNGLSRMGPSDNADDGSGDVADDPALPTRVNDPNTDLAFSPFAGFTQNTSSTARCGNNVVVGFEDSRALLDTVLDGTGGVSFSGVAISSDGGQSFRDLGAVPAGSSPNIFLLGQPSLACSDSKHFFYAQSFTDTANNALLPSAIALSRSSDGGRTWSDPAPVTTQVQTDIGEFFDDGRVAVDPSNPNRVYVSYRHLFIGGFSTPTGLCPFGGIETLIEVVGSTDGGASFGPPVMVDEQCFDNNFFFHIGSRIAVSSKGQVFVASQLYTLIDLGSSFTQGIVVGNFQPGSAPNPAVFVDAVFQAGTDIGELEYGFGAALSPVYSLQGGFADLRGFDLAVDKSGGPSDGAVYVFWTDGRNKFVDDFASSLDGTYEFADVFFSTSLDGGNTFSSSAQLNSDLQPLDGHGFDHYQPTAAVDRTGKVAACWYDRRNDPQNFQFERFCASSVDEGATWTEFVVPGSQSTPSRGQDFLLQRTNMGDYDGMASDFLGKSAGFVDAFQWMSSGFNPDIRAHTFR
jgi:hypothetical protein